MATLEPKAICERVGALNSVIAASRSRPIPRSFRRSFMRKTGLWQIEQGCHEPRAGTIVRLCNALSLTADDLLGMEQR